MQEEFFEQVEIGETNEFGSYDVTEEEIIAFAEQYDPQPFHLSEEAGAETFFGGLVASGWHTVSMTMRMLVDNAVMDSGSVGAAGVDELRWPNPVRPGDTLSCHTEVVDKERDWRPGIGVVRIRTTTSNQDGAVVLSMVSLALYPEREE